MSEIEEKREEIAEDTNKESESVKKTDSRKKKRSIKQSQIIICAVAAIAVVGAAFGLNFMAGENQIPEQSVPLGSESNYPEVHFAMYRQAEGIPLTISAVSVERDLSISILDEDLQPVTNVGFEVVLTNPEGESLSFIDEDGSGKIYIDELEPGEYTIALKSTGRFIVPEPIQIEVKDKVESEVIENISEKIVNAKNVNAAEEDAAYGGKNIDQTPPPPLKDTVPYIESKTETTKKDVQLVVSGIPVFKPFINDGGYLVYKDDPNASTVSAARGVITATRAFALNYVFTPFIRAGETTEPGGEEPPEPPGPPDPPPAKPNYRPDLDSNGFFNSNFYAATDDGSSTISGWALLSETFRMTTTPQMTQEDVVTYYGWQNLDGRRYYYGPDGKPVTGSQVIQGAAYVFDGSGALQQQVRGVDVSTWQNAINWTQVRNSGIHFAIIRAGYRGYGSGVLVEDDKFRIHAQGAQAAGLKVGIYYFSQAVNEREAVEEASAAIAIARKYGIAVGYPIAIDIEYSNSARNGRADGISGATRTAVARAFCDTIRNAGYTPMIYASKSWFENPNFLIASQLTSYRTWLAHWAESTNYKGRIDIWQYTSSGTVPGISGRVDMNISYLGY